MQICGGLRIKQGFVNTEGTDMLPALLVKFDGLVGWERWNL